MLVGSTNGGIILGTEIARGSMCAPSAGSPEILFRFPVTIPAGGCLYMFRRTVNEALNGFMIVEHFPDIPVDP